MWMLLENTTGKPNKLISVFHPYQFSGFKHKNHLFWVMALYLKKNTHTSGREHTENLLSAASAIKLKSLKIIYHCLYSQLYHIICNSSWSAQGDILWKVFIRWVHLNLFCCFSCWSMVRFLVNLERYVWYFRLAQ